MSEKRFVVVDYETIKDTKTGEEFEWTLFVALFNELAEENEQLKVLLKEAEDEIERLKKTKQGLLESIVENDSNNAMILEFISNVRESEMCEGCKHKDKPVEWYLENGLSVTAGVCDRYEPED